MSKQLLYYQPLLFFYTFFTLQVFCAQFSNPGIVTTPVAHLVGQPFGNETAYRNIPVCGGSKNPYPSCPRVHQLLMHEIVNIIKYEGDEVFIDVPHTFYITTYTKVPQTRYWTSKKNIIPLHELKQRGLNLNLLPHAISFENPASIHHHENVVTLLKPYYDPEHNITYSAGTRFIADSISSDKRLVHVFAINPSSQTIDEIKIPRTSLLQTHQTTTKQKIQTFVDILKIWAHQDGYIPYVWGGCSFIHTELNHVINEHQQERNGTIHSWYERQHPHEQNAHLKSGFDCAGLINRAAQIAGIPFFYKNTITIAEHLKELHPNEQLQSGDIIWMRGHVMVIADVRHNTIIEARGYDGDYGRVHEIEIGKVFKGIKTFRDLKKAWIEKRPLIRLNKAGKTQDTVKEIKLLKMKSVF